MTSWVKRGVPLSALAVVMALGSAARGDNFAQQQERLREQQERQREQQEQQERQREQQEQQRQQQQEQQERQREQQEQQQRQQEQQRQQQEQQQRQQQEQQQRQQQEQQQRQQQEQQQRQQQEQQQRAQQEQQQRQQSSVQQRQQQEQQEQKRQEQARQQQEQERLRQQQATATKDKDKDKDDKTKPKPANAQDDRVRKDADDKTKPPKPGETPDEARVRVAAEKKAADDRATELRLHPERRNESDARRHEREDREAAQTAGQVGRGIQQVGLATDRVAAGPGGITGRDAMGIVGAGGGESPVGGQCMDGRGMSPDTAGNCCWAGQVWAQGHCVGVPTSCPGARVVLAESQSCVVPACPSGEVRTDDQVHCCWPGQGWSVMRQVCVGVPSCPSGLIVEKDACVSPDKDGDGIPNMADKCPDEPEDKNGYEDDDGCPDEAKRLRAAALVPAHESADAEWQAAVASARKRRNAGIVLTSIGVAAGIGSFVFMALGAAENGSVQGGGFATGGDISSAAGNASTYNVGAVAFGVMGLVGCGVGLPLFFSGLSTPDKPTPDKPAPKDPPGHAANVSLSSMPGAAGLLTTVRFE